MENKKCLSDKVINDLILKKGRKAILDSIEILNKTFFTDYKDSEIIDNQREVMFNFFNEQDISEAYGILSNAIFNSYPTDEEKCALEKGDVVLAEKIRKNRLTTTARLKNDVRYLYGLGDTVHFKHELEYERGQLSLSCEMEGCYSEIINNTKMWFVELTGTIVEELRRFDANMHKSGKPLLVNAYNIYVKNKETGYEK